MIIEALPIEILLIYWEKKILQHFYEFKRANFSEEDQRVSGFKIGAIHSWQKNTIVVCRGLLLLFILFHDF
jgi:hypothetical protein